MKNLTSAQSGRIYLIRWILRFLVLLSGIYQIFFGEMGIGILILISAGIIIIPEFFTRGFIKRFPIEIEIFLFIMVFLQLVLGEARDFYNTVPYYDKLVHYMIPLLLGVIGFLLFYTLYETGGLRTTITAMMIVIILTTLGLGSIWEILEYSSDVLIYPNVQNWHHFQGNNEQDAITDTMTDLIDDLLGAVFGAFLGLWYMKKAEKANNPRAEALVDEVGSLFVIKPSRKKKRIAKKKQQK